MRRALVGPDTARLCSVVVFFLALLFAAVSCEPDGISAGAFRGTVGSQGGEDSISSSSQSEKWTAWPLAGGDSSGRSRCAAVCGRRSGGGEEQEQCGVDLQFSGFEHDEARVVGVELDVGLEAGGASSLRAYGLDGGGVDIDYRVYNRRR